MSKAMNYNPADTEAKWQKYWAENQVYRADIDTSKPKFYVLDMFPYPSGAGLHVGHPLGYIASDIYSRYKRHRGFNVLHPMGYDSFGLPAEQYAIQTGQHPEITTRENIARYREQLDRIGFSFDWSREVRTSDPSYYKWTQWIFSRLFDHWYDKEAEKARPIAELVSIFESQGNENVHAEHHSESTFRAEDWKSYSPEEKQRILLDYRLAYLADTWVNWCPALGTVLANDEVVNGVSERGGHPVVQKKMTQWSLRISAYSERLLNGLNTIDWPEPLVEQQRNWIGKSKGAQVFFEVENHDEKIEVFTTRPDTIFGVSFMVLAPEHELVAEISTDDYKKEVDEYIAEVALKTERDRQQNVKNVTGQFTGAYALHPFTGKRIPIFIGEYVLAGYGTGAIMAVPCGDQRDYDFARKFSIPIPNIFDGVDISEEAYSEKDAVMANSDFLNGKEVSDAIPLAIEAIVNKGIGKRVTNYRLRDAIFSRQRYWGEPFPVYYENDLPQVLSDDELPLTLPKVDAYLPTEDGEPPLARAEKSDWPIFKGDRMEYNTMPGWAGSSWYFLRYMDPENTEKPFDPEKVQYWREVDLYIGGSEHATGHLLYARFWHKFLYDMGLVPTDEPFRKLINQGMILGTSALVYRINGTNTYVSKNLIQDYETTPLHVDVNMVENDVLDLEKFKAWRSENADAEFILEDGQYICGSEVEKMSKRWYNVVNPDDICQTYGADVLRMYEMFLGPLEQSKPWNTAGISGVHGFVKKLWRLFHSNDQFEVSDAEASKEELKVLHQTIGKVTSDIENFSFNTAVSTFMICVNELQALKCNKRSVLEPLVILLSPYAPHIAEELWHLMGNENSVTQAEWPEYVEAYTVESSHEYPVMFNGKMRFKREFSLDNSPAEIEKAIRQDEQTAKYADGKSIVKVIVVPKKIVNVVLK